MSVSEKRGPRKSPTPHVPKVFASGTENVAGAEPLEVISTGGALKLFRVSGRAGAIRPFVGEQAAAAVGARGIAETDGSGESISGVPVNEAAQRPIADDGVDNGIQIVGVFLAASDRNLVGGIRGEDVGFIEIARTVIRLTVVDILPARQSHGGLRTISAPRTGAEEAR